MSQAELLQRLEMGVQHPETSGFEVLDLLDVRSDLARMESELSQQERHRIERADRAFLAQAWAFYESVGEVADLAQQRERAGIPPSHWWWYLDELVSVGDGHRAVESKAG